MFYYAFKNEYIRRLTTYLVLCSVLYSSYSSPRIFAESCSSPCILINQDDTKREKIATGLTIATVLAVIGGVAWLTAGPGNKGCYSSSSSCSSHSSYCYSSRYRHHHCHCRSSSSSSSSSSSCHTSNHSCRSSKNNKRDSISVLDRDPQFVEIGGLPTQSQRLANAKNPEALQELSGVFMIYSNLPTSTCGNMTAFVRLPDGNMQILGSLPCSGNTGSSFGYGPFTQKGTYLFGIRIDAQVVAPFPAAKVGYIEINVNGLTVENHDFFIPVHSSNSEPIIYEYHFS